jgi:hypothetical protein
MIVGFALRGNGDEPLAVGRPIVFVNVQIRRRELANPSRSHVHSRQALGNDSLLAAGSASSLVENGCRATGSITKTSANIPAVACLSRYPQREVTEWPSDRAKSTAHCSKIPLAGAVTVIM